VVFEIFPVRCKPIICEQSPVSGRGFRRQARQSPKYTEFAISRDRDTGLQVCRSRQELLEPLGRSTICLNREPVGCALHCFPRLLLASTLCQ